MTAFKIESWIWYGIAISMVLLRLLARYLHFNAISRLQVEDWFMVFIACLYTILIVSLNICAKTNSNLIDPHDVPYLTAQDIADRIFGSKMILVVEQCMCAVQWGTKACLLMLYYRLTQNLTQSRLVKGAAIYVGFTYAVMEVLYFGVWCRPFHDYWQTPTDNVQCTTALHHLIVNLVFNLTSDLLIMSIPLPLLMRSQLELKRKILLILPFSLGFFSVVCAILSKNLSFTQPFSGEWVYWYTREASTVMIVSNMPYTWGLVRKVFHVHSFFGSSQTNTNTGLNNLTAVRTRDTDMEMVGGQVRIIQGVSMPVGRLSDQSEKGKKHLFRSRLWNRNPEQRMQRLPSSPSDTRSIVQGQLGLTGQWADVGVDKKDVSIGVDPTSSSSSASDGMRPYGFPPRSQQHPDSSALNKLYRLADDDLEMDIEKERKRSDARIPD